MELQTVKMSGLSRRLFLEVACGLGLASAIHLNNVQPTPIEETRIKREFLPVPDDRIIGCSYNFGLPSQEELWQRFSGYNETLEKMRNPDGSWGRGYADIPEVKRNVSKPLVRFSALASRGYLTANQVKPSPLFLDRAKRGLDYVLSQQINSGEFSGAFKWFFTENGMPDGESFRPDSFLYETGVATLALLDGYKKLGDPRYLEASRRAVNWAKRFPKSENPNYDMIMVEAMAEHFKVTGEKGILDSAIIKTAKVLSGQNENGYWGDSHNGYIWYHNLITSGLISLASAIPEGDYSRQTVLRGTRRAVNHFIIRQQQNGQFTVYPKDEKLSGTSPRGLIKARERLGWDLDKTISGMVMNPETGESWKAIPLLFDTAEVYRSMRERKNF